MHIPCWRTRSGYEALAQELATDAIGTCTRKCYLRPKCTVSWSISKLDSSKPHRSNELKACKVHTQTGTKHNTLDDSTIQSQVETLRRALVLPVEHLQSSRRSATTNIAQNSRHTFSRADAKSVFVTLMRRSRSASSPASVQTALMSAPDRSSFAVTNSSRSTSSERFIRDVCNLQSDVSKPVRIVQKYNTLEDMPLSLDVR